MENKGLILLVEDDERLNSANARALRLRGYEVYTALTLAGARAQLRETKPDVILLDVLLPDGNGFDFCGEIRDKTPAHILFLTAKAEHGDMIKGLMTGGDDYIIKPFHPEELMARVEAAMRRRKMSAPVKTVTKGALTLDILAARAFVNGADLVLTPKEFALLLVLAQNENKNMSAETLYEAVWNAPMVGDNRTVKKHVSELKSKLGSAKSGYTVTTAYGKGYCFEQIK